MTIDFIENNNLYLEYNPNIGGSIFKFQAKINNKKYNIFRSYNKRQTKNIALIFQDIFQLSLILEL